MNIFDAIKQRHSYRADFTSAKVPREHLEKILQAGLDAPSGANRQTVRLIGVDDLELLSKIDPIIAKPSHATARAAIIVFTPTQGAGDYAVQDYAAAIENMLLAITALGYASCWVEGYLTKYDGGSRSWALTRALNAPDGWQAVCYLPIGVPEEKRAPAIKKEFSKRAGINAIWEE